MNRPLGSSLSLALPTLCVALLSACSPPNPSCTIVESDGGAATLSCPDGTRLTLRDGRDGVDGAGCSASANDDGTYTLECADSEPVVLRNGADGQDGANCAAVDNGDGSFTITCPDSEPVTVRDGEDGEDGASCVATSNLAAGTVTVACPGSEPVTLRDGTNGVDGESCAAVVELDGAVTITCPGSEPLTLRSGTDGTTCSIVNASGLYSLVCSDGTSVVVATEGCGNAMIEAGETCDDGNTLGDDRCSADCRVELVLEAGATDNVTDVARAGDKLYASGTLDNTQTPFLTLVSLSTGEVTSLASGSIYGYGLVATETGAYWTELVPGAIHFSPATGEASTRHTLVDSGMVMGLLQVGDEFVFPVNNGAADANGVFAVPVAGGTPRRIGTQDTFELVTDGAAAYTVGNSNRIHRQPLDGPATLVLQPTYEEGHLAQALAVSDTEVFGIRQGDMMSDGPTEYVAVAKEGGDARVLAEVDGQASKLAFHGDTLFSCEGYPSVLVGISAVDGAKRSPGHECRPGFIRVLGEDLYWSHAGRVYRARADVL